VLTVDPGMTNGEAEGTVGGDIITRKRYANFELTADFKTYAGLQQWHQDFCAAEPVAN